MTKVIYDSTRKRRVTIYRREDGVFTFEEEHFSDEPHERCWIPQTYRRSLPICDTEETALREAIGRIDWLAP